MSPGIASVPSFCAIGCPGAASFCSTSFLLEEVCTSWCSPGLASGRSCCSLLSFCFVGDYCSSSPYSDGKPSWKGPFTMASAAVKILSLEKMFPPDAVGRCLVSTSSFKRRIMRLRPLSIWWLWLKWWDFVTTFFTTPNRLKYKPSFSSEMSGLDCTITRSCLAAPFAHSLYV